MQSTSGSRSAAATVISRSRAWTGWRRFADLAAEQAGLAAGTVAWQPDATAHAEASRLYRLYQRFGAAGLELSQALAA